MTTLRGHPYSITTLSFSADNTTLASGSNDGTVRVWSILSNEPGTCIDVLTGHSGVILGLTFNDDHLIVRTENETTTWKLSNTRAGPHKRRNELNEQLSASMRAISEEFTVLMSGDRWLWLLKGVAATRLTQFPDDYRVTQFAFSKNTVVIACANRHVLILDVSFAKLHL